MCSKIGDTTHCIALNFDIGACHLADQLFKSSKFDNQQLILRYSKWVNICMWSMKHDSGQEECSVTYC